MTASVEVKKLRKQLAQDGIHDPFALLAEALERNAELRERVQRLEALVRQR